MATYLFATRLAATYFKTNEPTRSERTDQSGLVKSRGSMLAQVHRSSKCSLRGQSVH